MMPRREPPAGDPLMQPFNALKKQKAELETLKKSTLDEVWVRLGETCIEIVPRDPKGFEELSGKIGALATKITHNEGILARPE